MGILQDYEAQVRKEQEAATFAAEARGYREDLAEQARRDLQTLVEKVQAGKSLVFIQSKRVTSTAADLFRLLSVDFDSVASDKELAARLVVPESRIIGALAELTYVGLLGTRTENGRRRLMISAV